jgi:ABC-type phosphonate transport system ATPase subunit
MNKEIARVEANVREQLGRGQTKFVVTMNERAGGGWESQQERLLKECQKRLQGLGLSIVGMTKDALKRKIYFQVEMTMKQEKLSPSDQGTQGAGADLTDQIGKLAEMYKNGLLTDQEFTEAKA